MIETIKGVFFAYIQFFWTFCYYFVPVVCGIFISLKALNDLITWSDNRGR